jgi:hypothetical protein
VQNKGYPIPLLKRLSDVTFLTWKSLTRLDPNHIATLKYVFRLTIITPETMSILNAINTRMVGGIGDWPGVDLPIADHPHDYGVAALGTPHGIGVAYFLIQHKEYFPGKTISKIRVWTTGTYNMLFFIEDIVLPPSSSPPPLGSPPALGSPPTSSPLPPSGSLPPKRRFCECS